MPSRWTVGGLMWVVLAIGLALGLLRSPLGPIIALAAGGVIGCGLAPWFACRGMRKLDRELAQAQGDAPPSSPLARHRLVYATLGELMGGAIHALALKTVTPEEAGQSR